MIQGAEGRHAATQQQVARFCMVSRACGICMWFEYDHLPPEED